MERTRIVSVVDAMRDDDLTVAFRAIFRAEMMGVSLPSEVRVDADLLPSFLSSLHEAGIARSVHFRPPGTGRPTADWARQWTEVAEAIEASPYPDGEWSPALELFGESLLASLLSIHPSSVRRYSSGERVTPDAVAIRLHELGRIVSALAGSYNDFGIRRWFERPRPQLDGRSPRQLLVGDWSPDDPDVRRVVDLAEALLGAGAVS